LYFVIKDHPFIDGNKRIGSLLFLLYLQTQEASLPTLIDDVTLVALALLIAESDPKDKELMVKLIMNLITRG
jgi:DNA ligase (NAD+)